MKQFEMPEIQVQEFQMEDVLNLSTTRPDETPLA